jgi:predicted ribonuclease YlaK
MAANKYGDVRWKWLDERGFDVLADKHQYAYMQSLWAPVDIVQGVFCEAKAGTGKTTLAVLAGVYEVEKGTYDKIIYVRNAVPVRDLGFLPGDLNERQAPYMSPLIDAMDVVQAGLFEKWSQYNPMRKEQPKVVALTTSYVRGVNWKRSFVILDEAQNYSLEELQACLTRPDDDCKVVVIGSARQIDDKKQRKIAGLTPFEVFMEHFRGMNVTYHKLETVYRGTFASHADDVMDTVKRLEQEGK